MDSQSAPSPANLQQRVRTGPLDFVLAFDEAREYIEGHAGIVPIPRAPEWVAGMASNAGLAFAVVDLARWVHRQSPRDASPARHRRSGILRLGDGAQAWAFRLDEAPEVIDLNQWKSVAPLHQLPLQISALYGALMAHASGAWSRGAEVTLAIDWPAVSLRLRQDVASFAAHPATTTT